MARSLAAETSATAPVAPSPGVRLRRFAVPALSLLALLALWQIAAMLAGNPRLMPPPSRVLAKILADSATGELPWNLALTLLRVAASFAIAMTVGVYGLVAGIVKLDDLGLWLTRKGRAAAAVGRAILASAPWLMKALSFAGTAAMFLVGGGILVHSLPALHHAIEGLAPGGGWGTVVGALANAAVGIVAGALVLGAVTLSGRLRGKASHAKA